MDIVSVPSSPPSPDVVPSSPPLPPLLPPSAPSPAVPASPRPVCPVDATSASEPTRPMNRSRSRSPPPARALAQCPSSPPFWLSPPRSPPSSPPFWMSPLRPRAPSPPRPRVSHPSSSPLFWLNLPPPARPSPQPARPVVPIVVAPAHPPAEERECILVRGDPPRPARPRSPLLGPSRVVANVVPDDERATWQPHPDLIHNARCKLDELFRSQRSSNTYKCIFFLMTYRPLGRPLMIACITPFANARQSLGDEVNIISAPVGVRAIGFGVLRTGNTTIPIARCM